VEVLEQVVQKSPSLVGRYVYATSSEVVKTQTISRAGPQPYLSLVDLKNFTGEHLVEQVACKTVGSI